MDTSRVFYLRLANPPYYTREVLFFYSPLKLFLPHQLSWWLFHNIKRKLNFIGSACVLFGTPDRSRTCDLQNRNLTLYPTELRVRKCGKCGTAAEAFLF